jgi:hypothetical protein
MSGWVFFPPFFVFAINIISFRGFLVLLTCNEEQWRLGLGLGLGLGAYNIPLRLVPFKVLLSLFTSVAISVFAMGIIEDLMSAEEIAECRAKGMSREQMEEKCNEQMHQDQFGDEDAYQAGLSSKGGGAKAMTPWRKPVEKRKLLLLMVRLMQALSTDNVKLWLMDGEKSVKAHWDLFANTLYEQPVFIEFKVANGESVRKQFTDAIAFERVARDNPRKNLSNHMGEVDELTKILREFIEDQDCKKETDRLKKDDAVEDAARKDQMERDVLQNQAKSSENTRKRKDGAGSSTTSSSTTSSSSKKKNDAGSFDTLLESFFTDPAKFLSPPSAPSTTEVLTEESTKEKKSNQERTLNLVFDLEVNEFMEKVGMVYDGSKESLLEEITIGILVFTFIEDVTTFKSAVKEFGLGALDAQKIFLAFRNALTNE